jgi:plastocyanin
MSKQIIMTAMAALLLPLAALPEPIQAEELSIRVENFTFNPPEITIKPGTTVTWENADDIPHSIVGDNGSFHSKALDTGEKFSMTFADPAAIAYFCGLHPHMKGIITVKP